MNLKQESSGLFSKAEFSSNLTNPSLPQLNDIMIVCAFKMPLEKKCENGKIATATIVVTVIIFVEYYTNSQLYDDIIWCPIRLPGLDSKL